MSDEFTLESDARRESLLPPCPVCGAGVSVVTVYGPLEGEAFPCGCRVSPAVLGHPPDAFTSSLEDALEHR
ncbi:hypothetical protein [Natrarchaeobius chitinivorans]|uniref:Small CPxCG-related zinc finger protein n=1 Tax=Natrarchaeobius chitinivorans TaxID=1679083 RepID=A0A3N6M2V8_NATCH|nr:hypothetical protein [Natrarchaeobius chitinivorans]RQG97778.1 hypothetical protein EA473_00770 [Natrarchaeobius chitinivorans]